MRYYEHIFFDLDRTIWDFETNSNETLYELADKYNLADKGICNTAEFIAIYIQINNRMWEEYGKGLINKKTLRNNRFYEALCKYGVDDKKLSVKFANYYISYSPLKTNLLPHALEVLKYLKNKYPLHIITNGFEEVQYKKIKNCGLEIYFDEIITSERTGYNKPDIRMFEYSLNLVKAQPNRSLMIGDNLAADIIGARNAGIQQVYFNPNECKHAENITFEIKKLNELISIL